MLLSCHVLITHRQLSHLSCTCAILCHVMSSHTNLVLKHVDMKSQFFILYEQQPHLNNMHTVFGQVLDGWETLDKWERLPVKGKSTPIDPPEITGITIHANPLADEGITYPTPNGPPEKK